MLMTRYLVPSIQVIYACGNAAPAVNIYAHILPTLSTRVALVSVAALVTLNASQSSAARLTLVHPLGVVDANCCAASVGLLPPPTIEATGTALLARRTSITMEPP